MSKERRDLAGAVQRRPASLAPSDLKLFTCTRCFAVLAARTMVEGRTCHMALGAYPHAPALVERCGGTFERIENLQITPVP